MMALRQRRFRAVAVVSACLFPCSLALVVSFNVRDQGSPRHLFAVTPSWRNVDIDYSAANEYIQSHYGNQHQNYFTQQENPETQGIAKADVYDARQGVYNDDASLNSCGFELVDAPTAVTYWTDMEQIKSKYLPELDKIIEKAFRNAQNEDPLSILHVFWWQPMSRGEGVSMTKSQHNPTAPMASMVHMDTDVGAFDAEDLVSMVEHNLVDRDTHFPRSEIEQAINGGHRFAIVNVWRNADFEHPIHRAPLGILASRYKKVEDDKQTGSCGFPDGTLDPPASRWYTFPSMKHNECLFFKQYDRNIDRPSDLWHCALPIDQGQGAAGEPLRRSFDIRALVVFGEKVPSKLRFHRGRTRPVLSFKESECFCTEQAKKRQPTSDTTDVVA